MKLFRRRRSQKTELEQVPEETPQEEASQDESKMLSLVLQTMECDNTLTFPPEVVESMRRAISRLISKKALPARLSLTAALHQEGVTYLSRALATTMANDLNANVCVVELNWWRPDETLVLPPENKGLAGVLTNDIELESAIIHTDRPNLTLLPAGKMAIADRPVFARSDYLKEILFKLNEQFEYLILDVPAILPANDAVPLVSFGDACCLVINQGVTSIENARLALDEIAHLKILGVVLNKVKTSTPDPLLRLIPQDLVAETGGSNI